jgi:hypothetical protein
MVKLDPLDPARPFHAAIHGEPLAPASPLAARADVYTLVKRCVEMQ